MAIDKLVNSTELDNGLTTIADAIRTKGGTSAPLAFPDGMAQAIADIESGGAGGNYNIESVDDGNGGQILNITDAQGGGGIDIKSATRCEVVTVGANSVTNPVAALEYFGYAAPFSNLTIIALDAFTVNNEFGYFASRSTSSSTPMGWWRWRDNAINWPTTFNTSWDTWLVEGKKYLVIEW